MTKVFLKCLFCFCSKSHEGNFCPNIRYAELFFLWQLNRDPKKRKAIKESFQNPNGTFDHVKPDKIVSNPIGKAEKKAKKPKSHERKKPKTVSQIKDIREDKNFNKMVTDHKQKMMAGFAGGKKRKQWFDE